MKDDRWIVFEADGRMVWLYEGSLPRTGTIDWGDTKASMIAGASRADDCVDLLASNRLRAGWTETAVGSAAEAPKRRRRERRVA